MKFSKETAKGLELLSDIMRYSLQNTSFDGRVPLKDEVKHLHNYVELHQMRFENKLNIDFQKSGDLSIIRIPPHILITLVENAFKHGAFNETDPPLKIDLSIDTTGLRFSVTNKINHSKKALRKENSGIGLSNIQLRIEKEYGKAATLDHKIEDDFFYTRLYIPVV